MTAFREDLQCRASALEYNFVDRSGVLHLEDGDCTDMDGCVALFVAIDPDVLFIETFSGKDRDTAYRRLSYGRWVSSRPTSPPRKPIDPRERAARALCRRDGHPENIKFEGKPMWQSYLDIVDLVFAEAKAP